MSGARKREDLEKSGGSYVERRGSSGSLIGRFLGTMRGRILLSLAAIAVVGIVAVGRLIWLNVRDHVAARDDYRLSASEISITPPPPGSLTPSAVNTIANRPEMTSKPSHASTEAGPAS